MRNKLLFLALPLLFGLQASAQHTQAFQDTTLSDEPVSYTHLGLCQQASVGVFQYQAPGIVLDEQAAVRCV